MTVIFSEKVSEIKRMFVGQTVFKLTAAVEQSWWTLLWLKAVSADDDVVSVDEDEEDDQPDVFHFSTEKPTDLDSTDRHVSGKYLVQICVSKRSK